MVIVCWNCHRKLSDRQKEHPSAPQGRPDTLECQGRLLLGIADALELTAAPSPLIEFARETGLSLIEAGQGLDGNEGRQ
jgi:hypothetical protein